MDEKAVLSDFRRNFISKLREFLNYYKDGEGFDNLRKKIVKEYPNYSSYYKKNYIGSSIKEAYLLESLVVKEPELEYNEYRKDIDINWLTSFENSTPNVEKRILKLEFKEKNDKTSLEVFRKKVMTNNNKNSIIAIYNAVFRPLNLLAINLFVREFRKFCNLDKTNTKGFIVTDFKTSEQITNEPLNELYKYWYQYNRITDPCKWKNGLFGKCKSNSIVNLLNTRLFNKESRFFYIDNFLPYTGQNLSKIAKDYQINENFSREFDKFIDKILNDKLYLWLDIPDTFYFQIYSTEGENIVFRFNLQIGEVKIIDKYNDDSFIVDYFKRKNLLYADYDANNERENIISKLSENKCDEVIDKFINDKIVTSKMRKEFEDNDVIIKIEKNLANRGNTLEIRFTTGKNDGRKNSIYLPSSAQLIMTYSAEIGTRIKLNDPNDVHLTYGESFRVNTEPYLPNHINIRKSFLLKGNKQFIAIFKILIKIEENIEEFEELIQNDFIEPLNQIRSEFRTEQTALIPAINTLDRQFDFDYFMSILIFTLVDSISFESQPLTHVLDDKDRKDFIKYKKAVKILNE